MARKEKNIHYIYKTTCNVTGRWYIGMHSTNREDDGYMGSGLQLRRSIRKYGVESHTKEILEYCISREELILRETAVVTNELIVDDLCMNLRCGGEGGFISEEQQRHRSECAVKARILKKELNPEFAKKYSQNLTASMHKQYESGVRERKSHCDWTGRKHSEETKEKKSLQMKGKGVGETNSQYGTCWITKDDVNKKIKKEDLDSYLLGGWIKGRK